MAILRIPDPGDMKRFTIYVNGETITLTTLNSTLLWSDAVSYSSINGTIVNGEVVWNTGSRLFYNGEVVKGTDTVVNGRQYTVPTNYSLNLATLTGWTNVAAGSHTLTIKAKASGYQDSTASTGVTFEKVGGNPYITFTGETSEFTLAVGSDGAKEWDGTVEYSTDANAWTTWDGSAISSSNKKLYLRGKSNTKFYTSKGARFVLSARAGCSGNINTLLEYDNPPTTLTTSDCYRRMFRGCSNLTTAPELPAKTLSPYCYEYMFAYCSALTTAPELPATTLAKYCYYYMFGSCSSLTQAPALPATTLATSCYDGMFGNCTALTTAPELPATTMADSCYLQMFVSCHSLTQAPELPATTMAHSCYQQMFWDCTSLTTAPELPATTLEDICYYEMFKNCTALTQPPELPATTVGYRCYTNMFEKCTSLARAPELPALKLGYECYKNMFYNCGKLKISTTQTSEYKKPWRIPSSGTISGTPGSMWNNLMLSGTGGTFTSDPSINTTYYGAW